MYIFILVFALIYGGINYYIGLRGWQGVGNYIPYMSTKTYWIIFWIISLSYIIGRLGSRFLPGFIGNIMTVMGSYWMASMLYFILIITIIDIIRVIDRFAGFIPKGFKQHPSAVPSLGFAVLVLVVGAMVYGSWNARTPEVINYDITIPKSGGKYKELKAVMVSDIHLGNIIHNGRLTRMVDMINSLNPDLVLLAGDTIDEDVGPFINQNMGDTFKRLKPAIGTFAVLGNHEYIGGKGEEAAKHLEEAGVKVLRDSFVNIDDSFYIVGRDDLSGQRFGQAPRKKLDELLAGTDKSKSIILLDHQPSTLEEAQKSGADLQLSGHTHRGQIFPNQLITERIFEVDWGYLKKDSLQVVVSSGFGTWGPPVRIGNSSEIVNITIHFAD